MGGDDVEPSSMFLLGDVLLFDGDDLTVVDGEPEWRVPEVIAFGVEVEQPPFRVGPPDRRGGPT
jgi:hypothetical protein